MISKSSVKSTGGEWHLAHSENKHGSLIRFFNSAFVVIFVKNCIMKPFLDSVFVISGIIKVSVSVMVTLTSTLIIPDITTTSSNNCL